jgi:hypothetical protein
LLCIPAALAYACGGSDNTQIDAGNDGTVGNDGSGNDGSSNNDSGKDTGTGDTGANDSGSGDSGGMDSGSTDGGSDSSPMEAGPFACAKPSDCMSGFCCGSITFNGGSLPNCTLEDASSACKTTCNSSIAFSCTATDTIRLCAAKNDCLDAGSGYTQCCNVKFADAAVDFCWNGTYAGLAGGSCL